MYPRHLASTCAAIVGLITAAVGLDSDAACAVYPRSQGTEIKSAKETITRPVILDNCLGLTLLKGDATVCEKLKGGPKCDELKRDVPWKGTMAGGMPIANAFAVMIAGAPLVREGGSRMDESRDRIAGLPYGKILPPSGALRIPLTAPALAGKPVTFSISLAGAVSKAVFSTQAAQGARALDIPARVLTGSPRFVWTLTAGAQTYKGQISFAARDEVQEAEEDLRRVDAQTALSEPTRKLWKALIYDDHGLSFESERMQLELREGA